MNDIRRLLQLIIYMIQSNAGLAELMFLSSIIGMAIMAAIFYLSPLMAEYLTKLLPILIIVVVAWIIKMFKEDNLI